MPAILDDVREITLSDTLVGDIKHHILDLIKEERKRRSMTYRLGHWLNKLKCYLVCCCGNSKCIVGETQDITPVLSTIRLQREPDVVNGPRRIRARSHIEI